MSRPRPARRAARAFSALVAFFVAALAAAVAARAQQPPEPPAAAFGERVDVVLVEVETVVTDRQGRRVAGLGRDDFRLLVDGEPVEIAVFEEVRRGDEPLAAAPPAGEGAAPAPAADPAATVASTARYLVFVDRYFGSDAGRLRVLERLRDDLGELAPGDEVAIVGWDGSRLDVELPWTSDRVKVGRTLDHVAGQRGGRAERELRGTVSEEQRNRKRADQLEATVRAVTAALQGFAGGPGRSVALLVSGGWPFDPGGGSGFRSLLMPDTRAMVRRLAEVANASGFTLYPIDAPGAQPSLTVTAAVAGLDDVPGAALQPLEAPVDPDVVQAPLPTEPEGPDRMGRAFESAWEEFDAESTLLLLAEETGGVALINGQRTGALRQAVADLSSYYRLGFYHAAQADGTVRRVEVEVDRPGLAVRSRRSFADLTVATRAEVALEQALLMGVAPNAEPLAVRLGEARPAGRNRVQVPFEVEIPMGEVTALPSGEGRIAVSLELHVAVEDEEGRRNTVASMPIDIETVAAALGGHVVWEAAVTLRRQAHEVVFALSDPASGRVFVGRAGYAGS